MRERPILFSGPMVKAILSGVKTQTRRILRPQPVGGDRPVRMSDGWEIGRLRDSENAWRVLRCPYGESGDRLWVRESWSEKAWTDSDCTRVGLADAPRHPSEDYLGTRLRAIHRASYRWAEDAGPWKPSIHMPRWACRLLLEVTSIRVQRAQDISADDALAEGVKTAFADGTRFPLKEGPRAALEVHAFAHLWDLINGKRAPWASNPWVWAITFKRTESA